MPVPTAPPSRHRFVKVGTIARINGLNLTPPAGGAAMKVYDQILPDETNAAWPSFLVTTLGEREGLEPATTEAWDWIYPVRVWLCDRASGVRHDLESWFMYWRQTIFDSFRDQQLVTPDIRCYKCDLDP